MGTRRRRERQQDLWIAASDVVQTPANAFYDRLNQISGRAQVRRQGGAVVSQVLQARARMVGRAWRRGSTFAPF